jgi:hypothetical protein
VSARDFTSEPKRIRNKTTMKTVSMKALTRREFLAASVASPLELEI